MATNRLFVGWEHKDTEDLIYCYIGKHFWTSGWRLCDDWWKDVEKVIKYAAWAEGYRDETGLIFFTENSKMWKYFVENGRMIDEVEVL